MHEQSLRMANMTVAGIVDGTVASIAAATRR
jgi:hypothetical protein